MFLNYIEAENDITNKENIYEIIDDNGNIEIFLSLDGSQINNLSEEDKLNITKIVGDDYLSKKLNNARGRGEYFNEYGSVQRKVFKGFAGNQPVIGTQFPTGGGFYWSYSEGPEASLSIDFSGLSKYLDGLSVSVNLGVSGSFGLFANAPTTTDYYKLYVEREYDCTPYVTYYRNSTGEVSAFGKNIIKVHVIDRAYSKKS
ncbi:MAG: hypothetical protein Q4C64_00035 [Erysipelotrichia bacterium]|nr:hypothetical protein [Erysipelotrichia bacterium]